MDYNRGQGKRRAESITIRETKRGNNASKGDNANLKEKRKD